jgi:hypothetical protein
MLGAAQQALLRKPPSGTQLRVKRRGDESVEPAARVGRELIEEHLSFDVTKIDPDEAESCPELRGETELARGMPANGNLHCRDIAVGHEEFVIGRRTRASLRDPPPGEQACFGVGPFAQNLRLRRPKPGRQRQLLQVRLARGRSTPPGPADRSGQMSRKPGRVAGSGAGGRLRRYGARPGGRRQHPLAPTNRCARAPLRAVTRLDKTMPAPK